MKSYRWTVSGPLAVEDLGLGSWRLVTGSDRVTPADPPIEILIRGAGPEAADCFSGQIVGLTVEWGSERPRVSVRRAGVERVLQTRSVFVHEPRPRIYDALPLARFDADARRFWRRIFRVMRLPGGRWLLKLLARRRRA